MLKRGRYPPKKSSRATLKEVCRHGWLVRFLHNANYASSFAMEHEKLFLNDKLQRCLKETCPSEAVFQTLQTTKKDLSKTVRLTIF